MKSEKPVVTAAPEASDFFGVRSLLSEDERAIQEVVARFVDERILPIIADAFNDHRFPGELVGELAKLGLFGLNIDGYGCAGLSNVCYGLVCQELERGDSSMRSFVSVRSCRSGAMMEPSCTFSDRTRCSWPSK